MVRVWFANRRQKQKKQPSNPELDLTDIQNLGEAFFDDFDDPASDYDDFPGWNYQTGQEASVIVLNNSGAPSIQQESEDTDINDFLIL